MKVKRAKPDSVGAMLNSPAIRNAAPAVRKWFAAMLRHGEKAAGGGDAQAATQATEAAVGGAGAAPPDDAR
jgi:hypothetical protein